MLPDDRRELLSYGVHYLAHGEVSKATNMLIDVVQRDPENVLALAELKRLAMREGDLKEIEHYENNIRAAIRLREADTAFGPHDPWSSVLAALCPSGNGPGASYESYVRSKRCGLHDLGCKLGGPDGHTEVGSSYSDEMIQQAYMLFLFPYHIEPIFQELSLVNLDALFGARGHLSICLNGCGPAPELLGITRYVSERMPGVKRLDAHLCDVNDWHKMQDLCREVALTDYRTRADLAIAIYRKQVDLTGVLGGPLQEEDTSNLYVFQNCLRDINFGGVGNTGTVDALMRTFINIPHGSVMVWLDLKYPLVRDIFQELEDRLDADRENAYVVRSRNNQGMYRKIDAAKPEFIQKIESESGWDGKDGKAYYSLVALRL